MRQDDVNSFNHRIESRLAGVSQQGSAAAVFADHLSTMLGIGITIIRKATQEITIFIRVACHTEMFIGGLLAGI